MTNTLKTTTLLAALALCAGMAQAQTKSAPLQGVSATEITLGSIQDLSGPLAGFGKQARLGMLLAVDEINEQGGLNGRKLKLVVEDSAYDPKKAFGSAKTGQPGQDFHDGRPHWHGTEPGSHAGAV